MLAYVARSIHAYRQCRACVEIFSRSNELSISEDPNLIGEWTKILVAGLVMLAPQLTKNLDIRSQTLGVSDPTSLRRLRVSRIRAHRFIVIATMTMKQHGNEPILPQQANEPSISTSCPLKIRDHSQHNGNGEYFLYGS